jgi:hypothetical protein
VFPDFANVCDQHGLVLQPLAPGWDWRSWLRAPRLAGVAVALGLVATALAATPWLLARYIERNVHLEVVSIELKRDGDPGRVPVDLSQWLADRAFHVTVRVQNNSLFSFELVRAAYKLTVNSVSILETTWPEPGAKPYRLDRGNRNELSFKILLKDPALRGILFQMPAEGFHVALAGDAVVRIFGVDWKTPVRKEMRLRLRLPFSP